MTFSQGRARLLREWAASRDGDIHHLPTLHSTSIWLDTLPLIAPHRLHLLYASTHGRTISTFVGRDILLCRQRSEDKAVRLTTPSHLPSHLELDHVLRLAAALQQARSRSTTPPHLPIQFILPALPQHGTVPKQGPSSCSVQAADRHPGSSPKDLFRTRKVGGGFPGLAARFFRGRGNGS
jgi:hypothetical protein